MLTVIFGAGASHDSVDLVATPNRNHQWQPPLAAALFAERYEFVPAITEFNQCLEIILHMRSRIATGQPVEVEKELEELAEQEADYPERRNQLIATQFYLQKIMWDCGVNYFNGCGGATNYLLLADKLLLWHNRTKETIRFVTFNYDTLLESALERRFGLTVSDMDGYVARDDLKLLKVHGSVNWGHPVTLTDAPADPSPVRQALIERAPHVPGDKFALMGNPDRLILDDRTVLSPAIALPLATKSGFEFPQHHLDALRDALGSSAMVVMVGWRGADEHFLHLWSEAGIHKDMRMLVVANDGDGAQAVRERVCGAVGIDDARVTPSGERFSTLLRGAQLEDFLYVR